MLKPIVLFVIALVAAGAGYLWLSDLLAAHTCLDAGGVWDHTTSACRYK